MQFYLHLFNGICLSYVDMLCCCCLTVLYYIPFNNVLHSIADTVAFKFVHYILHKRMLKVGFSVFDTIERFEPISSKKKHKLNRSTFDIFSEQSYMAQWRQSMLGHGVHYGELIIFSIYFFLKQFLWFWSTQYCSCCYYGCKNFWP